MPSRQPTESMLHLQMVAIVVLLVGSLTACGGGSSNTVTVGTFTLSVSPTEIGMTQGSTQEISVAVRPQNGFTGSVQITASGLPLGVTASPAPLIVTPGLAVNLQLQAASNATTGTTQVTLQGADGTITAQISFPITVNIVATPVPRPFVTTGGGVERGFYDETRGLLYATNPSLNEIDVLSESGDSLVVQNRVSVPQPFGIDQMPDGNTLVIGTLTQGLYTLDQKSLTVTPHLAPNFSQAASTTTLYVTPVAMANGKVLVIGQDEGISLGYIFAGEHLIEWDPASNTFTQPSLTGPNQITLNEFDGIKRSADHNWAFTSSGNLYLYSSASDSFTSVAAPNDVRDIAVNPDGTQLAVAGAFTVTFYDQGLAMLGSVTTASGIFEHTNIQYSANGSQLFWELFGGPTVNAANASIVDVLDTTKFVEIGDVTSSYDLAQIEPTLLWVDNISRAFLSASGGVGTVRCTTLRQGPPSNDASGIPFPSGLPLNATAPVTFDIFDAPAGTVVTFGGVLGIPQPGPGFVIDPPMSATAGPVDTVFTLPDGEAFVRPQGFSYGLTLSAATATLLPPTGNPHIGLFGFGMQDDPFSTPIVTIAGQATSNSSIFDLSANGNALEGFSVQIPNGTAGSADIRATSSFGSDTLSGAVAYIPSASIVPTSGLIQLLYDTQRNLVYGLTSTQVLVFNPSGLKFTTPIVPGGSGGKSYLAMTLTPDATKLLIVDSGANTLTIVNPDNQNDVSVTSLSRQPRGVVATNTGMAFVPTGEGVPIEFNLTTLISTDREDDFPNLDGEFVATPDGSHIAVAILGNSSGTVSVWNSSNDSFSSQGLVDALWSDLAITPSGSEFAALSGDPALAGVAIGFFDNQLHYLNSNVYPDLAPPDAPECLGARFTATGKTLIVPLADSIDFVDGLSGTLRGRLLTPEPLNINNSPNVTLGTIAMDPTSQSIFAISASGLTILKLPVPADQLQPPIWPFAVRSKQYEGLSTQGRIRQHSFSGSAARNMVSHTTARVWRRPK